jgi:Transposase IS4
MIPAMKKKIQLG